MNNIDKAWIKTSLGEVAHYINGRAFKPTEWEKVGLPIIRIQNLNNLEAPYNYSKKDFEARYRISHGDLLFAWSASLGAFIWKGKEAWLNQHIFKVEPHSFCSKAFLYYLLKKIVAELYAHTHGSGMVHITKGKFENTEILLPPLAEQQRIVVKIEELFSSLDKAIESITNAKEQLKVYRQAVLKYAFEGRFTNDNVKDGELPKWWELKRISDIATIIGGFAFKSGDFQSNGLYQVIRIGNIRPGIIRLEESPIFLSNIESKVIQSSQLKVDDLVITQTGTKGKRDYGYTALIKQDNLLLNQRVASIRCNGMCNPRFLLYYTWTKKFKNQFFSYETGNVGQGNVGMKAITNTELYIPPITEQNKIVSEIDSRLSVCDKIEEGIENSLLQAEALRQSILKKAFEGKLVPQDPNDEPANKLIERIKAERSKSDSEKKHQKWRKTKL